MTDVVTQGYRRCSNGK